MSLKWILVIMMLGWLIPAQQSLAEQDRPLPVEVLFVVDYVKENEYSAHLIINNEGTLPLKNWQLGFTFQRSIDSLLGATLLKQVGDYYLLGSLKTNDTLLAHQAIRVEIKGKYTLRNIDDAPAAYFISFKDSQGQQSQPQPINGVFTPPQTRASNLPESIYELNVQHNNTPIEGNPLLPLRPIKPALIVPQPAEMDLGKGAFLLKPDTRIVLVNGAADYLEVARYLANSIQPATGYRLEIEQVSAFKPESNVIYLIHSDSASLGAEGYTLQTSTENIIIEANTRAGIFYGVQSLRQLFPPQLFSHEKQTGIVWSASNVSIKDAPRFSYRGLLFDVARHFFTVDEVKRMLDLMSIHKLNVLHWHLTDDEGWRIEIKQYPQLTDVGAWRGVKQILPPSLGSGINRYGGFYSQEQIRDIVAYAQSRQITIIPEIDMPGHARAMIQSLPRLLLEPLDKSEYTSPRGFHDNVLSPCNPATYTVISAVLNEVMDLFPSQIIHVGGDELPQGVWEKSPACAVFMKENGLKNTVQLRSYFTHYLQSFLAKHNRVLGGWEEISEQGPLANKPKPLIYAWLGKENWKQFSNYDLVLSPYQFLYLEMAYSANPQEPGEYWGGYIDTFRVYAFSPLSKVVAPGNIKGIEGGLWTEYIDNKRLDYFSFPKIVALSEVAWTQANLRNWIDFSSRLGHAHLPRLDYYNVLYRLPMPGFKDMKGTLLANVEFPGLTLRYSLNGTLPSATSNLYTVPVKNIASMVKMCSFNQLERSSCKIQ